MTHAPELIESVADATEAAPGEAAPAGGVLVVGLGYAGLSLTAALAARGLPVVGYDRNPEVVRTLQSGRSHLNESGVEEVIASAVGVNLEVVGEPPERLPDHVVVCVGTEFDHAAGATDLGPLEGVGRMLADRLRPEVLVAVRSTVPVGTSRRLAARLASSRVPEPLVAFCPERTIQGQALRELGELPQVVGGLDRRAGDRAERLFRGLGVATVRVSSPEAAELVKLVNNSHTDLIYGFGNEVARIAEALGVDAWEVIAAANLDYPRPDLARPGFVGGGCLSKDPYILVESAAAGGYRPELVAAARRLNESMPGHLAGRVARALATLADGRRPLADCRVLLCGFAYKGSPETDDLRGSPVGPLLDALRGRVGELRGHDQVVDPAVIAGLGATPVGLPEGLAGADAVVFLNNHRLYAELDLAAAADSMRRPALVVDCWALFRERFAAGTAAGGEGLAGVDYLLLGRGEPTPPMSVG